MSPDALPRPETISTPETLLGPDTLPRPETTSSSGALLEAETLSIVGLIWRDSPTRVRGVRQNPLPPTGHPSDHRPGSFRRTGRQGTHPIRLPAGSFRTRRFP